MNKSGRLRSLAFTLPPSSFLLGLFVRPVYAAATAELAEFETLGRRLLVLGRHVVAALALGALQNDIIARHNSPSMK
jgi:hypothetical protein